jgi:hypothetical protein
VYFLSQYAKVEDIFYLGGKLDMGIVGTVLKHIYEFLIGVFYYVN